MSTTIASQASQRGVLLFTFVESEIETRLWFILDLPSCLKYTIGSSLTVILG